MGDFCGHSMLRACNAGSGRYVSALHWSRSGLQPSWRARENSWEGRRENTIPTLSCDPHGHLCSSGKLQRNCEEGIEARAGSYHSHLRAVNTSPIISPSPSCTLMFNSPGV